MNRREQTGARVVAVLWTLSISATSPGLCAPPGETPQRAARTSDPSADTPTGLDRFSDSLAAVAEDVKDSVVNIRAKVFERGANRALREALNDEDHQPIPATSTGSGIILDDRGHIVTNNHVVSGAAVIWVTLADGARYKAKMIGVDPMTDIAVIQINAERLHPARLGDSDAVRVGHLVLAIGSPFRLGHSVSHGIISALGRNEDSIDVDIDYKNWLQTDAPINPGNSGGPLINTRGEVVGINVAIATESGGHQGVGFAIPSNTVRRVADVLRRGEKMERGYLGVSILEVNDDVASAYSLPERGGVLIREVGEDSPAAKGKLQSDDIVLAVNGKKVRTLDHLQELIAAATPGTTLDMTVWRDRDRANLAVIVGPQPDGFSTKQIRLNQAPSRRGDGDAEEEPDTLDQPILSGPFADCGFEAQTLTPELVKKLRVSPLIEGGVVITRVNPASEAFEANLRPGFVIIQANDQPIHGVRDLQDALSPEALSRGVRLKGRDGRGLSQTILRIR